jgi:plastocyanin
MRIIATLAVAFLVVASSGAFVTPAAAAKQTWTVVAGGGTKDAAVVSNIYHPRTIEVAVGDTVTWRFGPPWPGHTISFLGGEKPPALEMHEGDKVYFNPQVFFPAGGKTYDGTGYINSGAPPLDPKASGSYSVTFTKAGTYPYVNLLHGTTGTVVVKERVMGSPVAARAQGQRELAATVRAGQAALARWKPERQGSTIVLPMMGDPKAGWSLFRFSRGPVVVERGTTVTWVVRDPMEIHTVTFLGGAKVPEFITVEPQSQGPPKLLLNPKVGAPTPSKTYDGMGFANSGILFAEGAPGNPPSAYSLTFNKPGQYQYACVIHDAWGMRGTIVVK